MCVFCKQKGEGHLKEEEVNKLAWGKGRKHSLSKNVSAFELYQQRTQEKNSPIKAGHGPVYFQIQETWAHL